VGCVGEEQKDLTLENLYCCGEFRALGIIGYNKKIYMANPLLLLGPDQTEHIFSGLKMQGKPHCLFFFFLLTF